jgi:hypothetical protein
MGQDLASKPCGEPEVQRQVEVLARAAKVLVDLASGDIQPFGGVQDPRAHSVGEGLENLVVALGFEGDPDEAIDGGCEQQRPNGGVKGAVGHVENLLCIRTVGQAAMEVAKLSLGHGGQSIDQVRDVGSVAGVHWALPFRSALSGCTWRRIAMPSAAERRAASALPPSTAAMSL